MIEAFVIALREGVEAALVVCLLLAAVEAVGRPELRRPIFLGVGLACLASFASASLLRHEAVNEELFEGALMLTAALMVGTMMIWMWRTSRKLKAHIEGKVGALAKRGPGAAVGLFAFAFLMVVREGAEAALFLTASTLSSSTVAAAVGGGLGLLLAVAFGVAFARGSLRVDLPRFFAVTGLVLALLVVQLLIGGLHELGEGKLFPVSKREMAIVGPIVKNNVLFVLAIALIPLFIAVVPGGHKKPAAKTPIDPAEARKLRARALSDRRLRIATASLSIVIVALLGAGYVKSARGKPLSAGRPVTASDGFVDIPVAELQEASFHRFAYHTGSTDVRFIVVRAGDSWKVALDACELCGAAGYDGGPGGVICRLCDSPINVDTIGRPGGCNPMAISASVRPTDVRIAVADLEAAGPVFASPGS